MTGPAVRIRARKWREYLPCGKYSIGHRHEAIFMM
jgi:hypothetical protein